MSCAFFWRSIKIEYRTVSKSIIEFEWRKWGIGWNTFKIVKKGSSLPAYLFSQGQAGPLSSLCIKYPGETQRRFFSICWWCLRIYTKCARETKCRGERCSSLASCALEFSSNENREFPFSRLYIILLFAHICVQCAHLSLLVCGQTQIYTGEPCKLKSPRVVNCEILYTCDSHKRLNWRLNSFGWLFRLVVFSEWNFTPIQGVYANVFFCLVSPSFSFCVDVIWSLICFSFLSQQQNYLL